MNDYDISDFADILKDSLVSAFRIPRKYLFDTLRDRTASDSTVIKSSVRRDGVLSYQQQINPEAFSTRISMDEACQGLSALASTGINVPFADPSCFGCQNYHGKTYSGVKLVCAMHPSGWCGEDICPDKEPN
jgi:hypothetical protein